MKKKAPYFSIIIPTYNREKFILQTLDTVFGQSFIDYEIIVVDNCSTDKTIMLLSPLVESGKITLIQNDRNYERAKSRNVGMQCATGKYLTFLDSDDLMYPANLKDAYEYSQTNQEIKVFHNFYELVNSEGDRIYEYSFKPLTNALKQISLGNFLSCIGVFIHEDVYRSIFWDESPILTGSEDYDFWIRSIAQYPDVGRIPKTNSGIVHHDNRTINNQLVKNTQKRFEYMLDKYKNDPFIKNKYGRFFINIASTLWIFQSGLHLDSGEPKISLKLLFGTLVNDPKVLFRKNFLTLFIKASYKSILHD